MKEFRVGCVRVSLRGSARRRRQHDVTAAAPPGQHRALLPPVLFLVWAGHHTVIAHTNLAPKFSHPQKHNGVGAEGSVPSL